MIRRILKPTSTALICLGLFAGCGGGGTPESQVVGKWKIDPATIASKTSGVPPLVKQALETTRLDIKADKTFSYTTMLGTPTGTWTIDNGTGEMKFVFPAGSTSGNPLSTKPEDFSGKLEGGQILLDAGNAEKTVLIRE